jgi:hypothetical protein
VKGGVCEDGPRWGVGVGLFHLNGTMAMSAKRELFLVFIIIATVVGISSCTTASVDESSPEPPSSDLIQVEPWPEADTLFRSNPKWLGSDDAYSVDLGDGRVLWLFGDSFIATGRMNNRVQSEMIRNSVAIQSDYDPSAASIEFYWRTLDGDPRSFFPEEDDIWFWPGHGIVLGDNLLIFLMAIRSSSEGLGLESAGWRAVSVSDFEQAPSEWHLEWLETPENSFGLVVSGSVIKLEEYICAFCVQEPDHTIHLVRWPVAQATNKDLSQPQWWAGEETGWVAQQELVQEPQPLFSEGQNEFTVHYEPLLAQFLEIQTVGFGKADLGYRLADAPTGEWSSIERFYRPEEYRISKVMIYAAKAHPHLTGADLVLTYATNSLSFARLVLSDNLYYPRFLRASFEN